MFPCSSIYQHFPRANQAMVKIDDTTTTIQNPISSNSDQHYHSSPYSQNAIDPSIFEDDGVILSQLLSQHQLLACNNNIISSNNSQFPRANNNDETAEAGGDHRNKPSKGTSSSSSKRQPRAKRTTTVAPRKKKDRHSKIYTAQGLRDRRMRLSLQIARKFFDLQDMLGFDKASRTIDWLFAKSKTAIKELKGSLLPKHNSASSEGKAASERPDEEIVIKPSSSKETAAARKTGRKRGKLVVARESREKARARARERTREKILERSRRTTTTSEAVDQSTRANPKVEEGLNYHHYVGGTNSEEDFLGFPDQNCDMIENPYAVLKVGDSGDFYSAHEPKPSSNVEAVSASSDSQPPNPSLVFVPRTASNSQNHTLNLPVIITNHEQNPNYPTFMASLNISEHQEENSNIFCSLSF